MGPLAKHMSKALFSHIHLFRIRARLSSSTPNYRKANAICKDSNAELKSQADAFYNTLLPYDLHGQIDKYLLAQRMQYGSPSSRESAVSYDRRSELPAFQLTNKELSEKNKLPDAVKSIFTLEYARRHEIVKYNMQQAVKFFARSPHDTGSAEVQVACWTVRILAIEDHASKYLHDQPTKVAIERLKLARYKMLKYLKSVSLERFYTCLDRLALPHDILDVHMEKYPQHIYPHEAKRLRDAERSRNKH